MDCQVLFDCFDSHAPGRHNIRSRWADLNISYISGRVNILRISLMMRIVVSLVNVDMEKLLLIPSLSCGVPPEVLFIHAKPYYRDT